MKSQSKYKVGPVANGVLEAWGVYERAGDGWRHVATYGSYAAAAGSAAGRNMAEAKAAERESENQGMNSDNINEIVGRYLAANPETAKRLVAAAVQYEEKNARCAAAAARKDACSAACQELDAAIGLASDAVNKLKGDILRLQKERKAAQEELEKALREHESLAAELLGKRAGNRPK